MIFILLHIPPLDSETSLEILHTSHVRLQSEWINAALLKRNRRRRRRRRRRKRKKRRRRRRKGGERN
jgi:hypothetical protein